MAMRGYPNIGKDTITLVRKTAEELGYQPNLIARNLRSQSTKTIGFIFPDITYDYAQKIVEGAASVFEKSHYLPLIGLAKWSQEQEEKQIKLLLGYRVDGLICQPLVDSSKTYTWLSELDMPVVFVGNALDIPGISWVGADGREGMHKVVHHLVELGHRHIGLIATDTSERSMSLSEMVKGYREGLSRHDIEIDEDLVVYSQIGDEDSVVGCTKELLGREKRPSAIMAVSDVIAYQCMNYLVGQGVRIPEDVAVTGVGNLHPSGFNMVSLTTVAEDSFHIGQAAAEILLDKIEQGLPAYRKLISGELIVRRSTQG